MNFFSSHFFAIPTLIYSRSTTIYSNQYDNNDKKRKPERKKKKIARSAYFSRARIKRARRKSQEGECHASARGKRASFTHIHIARRKHFLRRCCLYSIAMSRLAKANIYLLHALSSSVIVALHLFAIIVCGSVTRISGSSLIVRVMRFYYCTL